jgi:hypothetical protein
MYMYIGQFEFPDYFLCLQSRFAEDADYVLKMLITKLECRLSSCMTNKGIIRPERATTTAAGLIDEFFTRLREFDSELLNLPEVPPYYYLVAFERLVIWYFNNIFIPFYSFCAYI